MLRHFRFGLLAITCAAFTVPLVGCDDKKPGVEDKTPVVDPDDIDGDGVPNGLDEDIDGDGVPNIQETGPDGDIDGDGIPNSEDTTDFGDSSDQEGPQGDIDGDGIPNSLDSDDDGDGIPDGVRGVGSCDGTTPAADEDHDCDGFCFSLEGGLLPCDDGAPPGSGQPDSDGDGLPDSVDPDDDGDGVLDGDDPNNNGQDPVDPTDPGTGQCQTATFSTGEDLLDPRVLLVVDKSGSMNDPFGNGNNGNSKWVTTQQVVGDVVTTLAGSVEFGLMVYPDFDGVNGDVCAEGALKVDVGPDTTAAIINQLNSIPRGSGGTPSATTLFEASTVLGRLTGDAPRAVVLATDGGPNCNGSLDGNTCRCVAQDPSQCQQFAENCLDDANTISAAAQLNAAGFPVFVIGISGSENFTDVLNATANAGGTGTSYPATSGDALAAALEDIAIRVGACRFDLPQNVSPADVTVKVNGANVARDTTRQNGWDLTDPNTVELFGVACQDAVNGGAGAATVDITFCPG
jgi:hypothetical protein